MAQKGTSTARKSAKLATSRKRPGAVDQSIAVSKGTPATPEDVDEEQPAKRRKSEGGPTKTRECATKDAPPKLKNGGLPFNATWYNSPLEHPKVYGMKDKAYVLDTYRDLADIIARVTEDHGRMKASLIKKGFLPESDDEQSEEENVFPVE
ncbi:hypothetical protein N7537_008799 [Penicillium hordei]|uniref:Uncharacterized protein n=1 Tax=Penicillium hordei TaxID=40994 RepID=A0AAD6GYS0_9EURO|nr:uncharacterized protein N7537_008799 [Penicillium hordei]KAJ5598715.1 hypothetical protein N7537_008799 [Penicillium hordei]